MSFVGLINGSVYSVRPPQHVAGADWNIPATSYNPHRLAGVVNNFNTPYDPSLRVSKILSEHPYNKYIESCVKPGKGADWDRVSNEYNQNRLNGLVHDQRFKHPDFLPPTVPNRKAIFSHHFATENQMNPFKQLLKSLPVASANYHRAQHEARDTQGPPPRPDQDDAGNDETDIPMIPRSCYPFRGPLKVNTTT